MKFYSEKLHEIFDTVEDLQKAENKQDKVSAKVDQYLKQMDEHMSGIITCVKELDSLEDYMTEADMTKVVDHLTNSLVTLMKMLSEI
jgi:uncharacterized coiled-coil DUF342 family protein